MKKIILVTEFINPPFDEGIKKTAFKIFNELKSNYDVRVICRYGFVHENIYVVKTNKLFLSNEIVTIIADFEPDALIYLPFQSSTFATYLRLKVLTSFNYRSKTILFALQPKIVKTWQGFLINYLKPLVAITPSLTLSATWDSYGIQNFIVPLSTNIEVYKPVSKNRKHELRQKYGLDKHAFIVSHMGHLNERRNTEALIPIQNAGMQVILVTSTSSPKSPGLNLNIGQKLRDEGVIVYDTFLECIEEIYQLSDAYVFPVIDENASIGMPLSILEARACGIPVVTTDYGSIKFFFDDDFGAIKYSTADSLLENCSYFKLNSQLFIESKVHGINDLFMKVIQKLV